MFSVDDHRRVTGRRLPRMVFDYLEGGALDEQTLRANTADLRQLQLRQAVMRDVSRTDLRLRVLGHEIRTPVLISPMGLLTVFRRDADVLMAQAAHEAGTVFVHSAWSGTPLKEVAAAAPGSVWAQLSLWRDERLVRQHLDRAADAGVDVLVIAGDVAVSSKRERDLRNGFDMAGRPAVRSVLNAMRKPRWSAGFVLGPRVTFGDQSLDGRPMGLGEMGHFMHEQENSAVTWDDVERIRRIWPGRLALKGVMTAEDARLAREAGLDAVFVSNHGGRQFDAQPSTTAALPGIVEAVGGDVEILVDGGIRRGSDIVALGALGATACLVGRPAVYGLVTSGRQGVRTILDTLADEAATALAFTGSTRLADVGADVLATPASPAVAASGARLGDVAAVR